MPAGSFGYRLDVYYVEHFSLWLDVRILLRTVGVVFLGEERYKERPLVVYGEGCKGNYRTLEKLARIAPVLPDYRNRRSLVSIGTLCGWMKDVLDREAGGIFFPQEDKPLCTCEMLREIAAGQGRRPPRLRLLNPAVGLLRRTTSVGRKAFGDLVYQDLRYLPFDG